MSEYKLPALQLCMQLVHLTSKRQIIRGLPHEAGCPGALDAEVCPGSGETQRHGRVPSDDREHQRGQVVLGGHVQISTTPHEYQSLALRPTKARSANMKIGVFSTFMSPNATPQMIRDFGRRAEGMGLDSVWMGEHVVLFDKQTSAIPDRRTGAFPCRRGAACWT
jgi:hypothetical protein